MNSAPLSFLPQWGYLTGMADVSSREKIRVNPLTAGGATPAQIPGSDFKSLEMDLDPHTRFPAFQVVWG